MYQCNQCEKSFEKVYSLNAHKKIHSSTIEQSYIKGKTTQIQKHAMVYNLNPTSCYFCNTVIPYDKMRLKLKERHKNKKPFCNRSCAALYHNQMYKKSGNQTSKLEKYLQSCLSETYKDLSFIYNAKSIVRGELDIYIPELKIAFELNGIFHYEPIFGIDRLVQSQMADQRKLEDCKLHAIDLHVIDTRNQRKFSIKTSQPYKDYVLNIINSKLATPVGFAPNIC